MTAPTRPPITGKKIQKFITISIDLPQKYTNQTKTTKKSSKSPHNLKSRHQAAAIHPYTLISDNRNTLEFIGIWEKVYNPDFNYGKFATIRNQSDSKPNKAAKPYSAIKITQYAMSCTITASHLVDTFFFINLSTG